MSWFGCSRPGRAGRQSAQFRYAAESGNSFTASTQFAPCRDLQRADDLVSPHHHHLIHHVDDDADMIRDDPHDVADIGAGVAAGEIEEAVLLGKARDFCSGCSRISP
jgi:hypothetical protein